MDLWIRKENFKCKRDPCIIGATQYHRDELEASVHGEELFRGVVLADGVLEGQVKLVLALGHAVALHAVLLCTERTINVNKM